MSARSLFVGLLVVSLILLIRIAVYFLMRTPFQNGEKIDEHFILLTEPRVEGKFQKFTFEVPGKGVLFITAPSYPEYSYGQDLRLRGIVKQSKRASEKTADSSSNGILLLRTENVINTMFFPTIEAKDIWYLRPLASLRKNLITIFSSNLSPASESLMLGIVFGIRSTMPKQLNNDLVTAGVVHITAASGMNVTMVAGAVFFLLAGILRRQVALVVGIIFVWVYAVLAGLEPSILRASIMSSFAFGASLLGRQNTSLLALGFTGVFMLILDPSLLGSAGFVLSVLSTLGIVLFSGFGQQRMIPIDQPAKAESGILSEFREDLKTTLAAQAGTLPILFIFFGQYNLLSIVVNGLILFTIPPLMILGGVGALVGLVFRPLGGLVLYLSIPILSYIELIVRFFAKIPVFIVLKDVSALFVIGYYLSLLGIFLFFRSKRV